MDVVGQQAVDPDAESGSFGVRLEQGQVAVPVGVRAEDLGAVVPAVGDVLRVSLPGEPGHACHPASSR
jgi:hypothetical protein